MEESITNDLMLAKNSNKLVNVYQIGSGVFYTGYVYKLNDNEVVLKVYDNYGMPNGLVYLKIEIVDQVDFVSTDLLHMQGKIKLADKMGLKVPTSPMMKITNDDNLIYQIVGRTYVENQILMISLYNQNNYVEGFIQKFDHHSLILSLVDEFDFNFHQEIKVNYDNIRLIELLGKELTMLRRSKSLLFGRHLKTIRYKRVDSVQRHLNQLGNDKYVLVMPKANDGMFFVGKVNAINFNSIVLNVIDMAGQFGGYVLMKFSNIDFIETQSDYLSIMTNFAENNRINHMLVQPILNNGRSFDPNNNWFKDILIQASVLSRIVRIQLTDGSNELLYPVQVTHGDDLNFFQFDSHREHLSEFGVINLSNIEQISFDYLGTFYLQERLKQNHEL